MKKLTKAEEEMMLILWKLDHAFLKDIIEAYPEPRPNQSTVSTNLRTLERKGFVAHKAYSKTFEYYTLVPKRVYCRTFFRDFLERYFDNSYEDMVSFLGTEMEMQLRVLEPEKPEKSKVEQNTIKIDTKNQMSLF